MNQNHLLLLRAGASLFPGLLRISASVTVESAEAVEARAKERADQAAAVVEGTGAPSLLPPSKPAAAVAAAQLNASQLLSRVAVAVAVGTTELLVFTHKVRDERRKREREREGACFFLPFFPQPL